MLPPRSQLAPVCYTAGLTLDLPCWHPPYCHAGRTRQRTSPDSYINIYAQLRVFHAVSPTLRAHAWCITARLSQERLVLNAHYPTPPGAAAARSTTVPALQPRL